MVVMVVINQELLLSSKGICHYPRGWPQGKPLFACVHIKFSIGKNQVCCFPAPSFTLLEIHLDTEGEQGSKGDLREYRKAGCFLGEAEQSIVGPLSYITANWANSALILWSAVPAPLVAFLIGIEKVLLCLWEFHTPWSYYIQHLSPNCSQTHPGSHSPNSAFPPQLSGPFSATQIFLDAWSSTVVWLTLQKPYS